MSQLSNRTERKAIKLLANTLRFFERLPNLKITSNDAFDIRAAENLIKQVIESNGYYVRIGQGQKTTIKKTKK